MKKIDLLMILLGLVSAALCYFTCLNLIYALIIFILYIFDYFILLRRKVTSYNFLTERVHICYHFINSFLTTLSVKDSLEDAYENATRVKSKKFLERINGVESYPVVDRIKYLRDYFDLSIYKMFLNVFDLYQDQGGNILTMSDNLLRECTRTEKILSETTAISIKHLIEFISLWGLSFAILLFMRFSIQDFYLSMLKNKLIEIMIFFFFVISIVSIHLFINAFVNLNIKKDYENEKTSK